MEKRQKGRKSKDKESGRKGGGGREKTRRKDLQGKETRKSERVNQKDKGATGKKKRENGK